MNYTTKTNLLKYSNILQKVIFIFDCLMEISILIFGNRILSDYYGYDINSNSLFETVLTAIRYLLLTIYTCFTIIYLTKKQKQTKQEFYSKTKFLKIFSIVSLLFSPIIAIILIYVAFTKDCNNEVKIVKEKVTIKPNKIKFDKETQKQIKELKHLRRRGEISQELYEKSYNEITKK